MVGDRAAETAAFELFRTPEGRTNPYPLYHAIRGAAPVHWSDTVQAWLLTRYDDCFAALRDPRLGKDFVQRLDATRPNWRQIPALARAERSMLNVDGPYHTRLRRAVSKVFTFRSVEAMRPSIEEAVDGLLDKFEQDGGGDLIEGLSFPLPVTVIGELLGVPADDRPQFRQWVSDLTAAFEAGRSKMEYAAADEATLRIDEYFYNLIDKKRARPGDDLLSRLAALADVGERLSDEELVTLASLLFAAGFETTTNLVGNGMLGLLKHPDQIAVLREHPEFYANLSDELLRYDGTAQMIGRQVKESFEIDGMTIEAGQTVVPIIAAGNHDPSRYHDPDSVDVTRTDIRPLSFGGGVHFCLGAALARAEIEIVFRKVLDRFGSIEIDGSEPQFRDRLTLRGLTALPLRVSRAKAATSPISRPKLAARPEAPRPSGTLRPSGPDDLRWRRDFRDRLERSPVYKSSEELAATIALFARVPLFRACRMSELERLAATAYPIAFDPMDVLCYEGAEPEECYVIAEGEALVTRGSDVIATVGPDDVVGERGPIQGKPRAATVTATTHMITYAISRAELEHLLEGSPAGDAMKAEVSRRYS